MTEGIIMTFKKSIFFASIALAATLSTAVVTPSFAQTPAASSATQTNAFFKKKYKIKGSWALIERDGKKIVKFSDDFKTKNGPDLKIFLSPLPANQVTGKNALDGSIKLGVLKSNKGGQEYEIPAGTNLSQFSTVLVHCEAYSILWGGGSL